MTRMKRKRRAKAPSEPKPALCAPGARDTEDAEAPPPDVGARMPQHDASVQDPLEDWPGEDEDRWLRERSGGDVEKPGE